MPGRRWTSKSYLSRVFRGFLTISGRSWTSPEVYGSGTAGHRIVELFFFSVCEDAPSRAPSNRWLPPEVVGPEVSAPKFGSRLKL